MSAFPCTVNDYGFKWGEAEVTRIHSDPKLGVIMMVDTPLERLELRVTPSGLIRVEGHRRKTRKTRKP